MATGVVLFDGVCNFCNASVNFIIDRNPKDDLKFAPLQSEAARTLLSDVGVSIPDEKLQHPDSILLVQNGKVYSHSAAALRIASHLSFPWFLGVTGLLVPWFLRDIVYKIVARNRYKWFGKSDACRVPTPEMRTRFLNK